jgi:2-keto-3-deoxy-L-rhamnonate aldolase RhmA
MTTLLGERLRAGQPAFGLSLTLAEPFVAGLLGAQPFDFLLVDTEHAPISNSQLQAMLISLRRSHGSTVVRVASNDEVQIMQALDLGADGVVVPNIETAADCASAVRSAFYPPVGARGVGPRRAGRLAERAPYLQRANDEVVVIIMIESPAGAENIDAIARVPGVGGVLIGMADLAAACGHIGEPGHPEVLAAVDRIGAGCRAVNLPFGRHAGTPGQARQLLESGARIVTVGSDVMLLEEAATRYLRNLGSFTKSKCSPMAAYKSRARPGDPAADSGSAGRNHRARARWLRTVVRSDGARATRAPPHRRTGAGCQSCPAACRRAPVRDSAPASRIDRSRRGLPAA